MPSKVASPYNDATAPEAPVNTTVSFSHPVLANQFVRAAVASLGPAFYIVGEMVAWLLWILNCVVIVMKAPFVSPTFSVFAALWITIGLVGHASLMTGYNSKRILLSVALYPLHYVYEPALRYANLSEAVTLPGIHSRLRGLDAEVVMLRNISCDCAQPAVAPAPVCPMPLETRPERPDFALYTAGGRILPPLTSQSNTIKVDKSAWAETNGPEPPGPWPSGPTMAIHYETQPGYCWPFKGTHGSLGVHLFKRIFVEEVTIDSVSAHLSADRSSTPRRMELWGQVDSDEDLLTVEAWQNRHPDLSRVTNMLHMHAEEQRRLTGAILVRLASFEYDIHTPDAAQTFAVDEFIHELPVRFQTVALVILDNWGKDAFTCLYRLRVHGLLGACIFVTSFLG